ncbi:MAG: GDP-mannose 4,6-dehydratase [Anaerolineae bacterium]|nr:GDP-mannose 4,6-dehydratase [Anaerolineae bacterium]
MTATWNGTGAKTVHRIASAGAIYHATSDHQVFVCQNGQPIEQPAGDVRTGDQLALLAIPTPPNLWTLSPDEAYQLGVTIAQDDLARIPQRILNADHASRLAFLQGFESIRLFDSATEVLAAGLYWLIATTYSQAITIQFDQTRYHLIADHGQTPLDRVTQATPIAYTDWLYDFATESGTFHAGIGQGWIHNSPRRGLEFVTRKVTYHAAMIKLHLAKELRMGNLDAQRDWGFAGDYVKAMWMMLQQPVPDDFVVATGETHSVERLLEVAFSTLDLNWKDYVVQDERFMRPAEVDLLIGDPSKAKHILNWSPEVSFEGLVQMMVEHDLQTLKRGGE